MLTTKCILFSYLQLVSISFLLFDGKCLNCNNSLFAYKVNKINKLASRCIPHAAGYAEGT